MRDKKLRQLLGGATTKWELGNPPAMFTQISIPKENGEIEIIKFKSDEGFFLYLFNRIKKLEDLLTK